MEFFVIVAVAGWILCGVLAGVVNRQRGGSFPTGCLIGFMAGPIGLALVALGPPQK